MSTEQLLTAGLSGPSISRRVRRGELRRLGRGVYLAVGAPHTSRAALWAAVLATGGTLRLTTAGRLWKVLDPKADDSLIHVAVPHSRRVVAPVGVLLHRIDLLTSERTTQAELPVTTRTCTVLDLLSTLRPDHASRLADRAVQRRWIGARDCERRLREHSGRHGNQQLRLIFAQLGDGAASAAERRLHRLVRKAGLRDWRANYEVWVGGDLIAVVDVAVPAARLAVEVDGMAYHVDVERFRADRSRQNALVALGWTVLRFTWADLIERPGYVIAVLRRVAG